MRRANLRLILSLLFSSSFLLARQTPSDPKPTITIRKLVFATDSLPPADRDFVLQTMQARLCPKDNAETCIDRELRYALRQIGYVKAEVQIEKLEFPWKDRPQDVAVTVKLVPGNSYILKDVQIKGADSLSFLERYRLPKPQTGQRFNASEVERLRSALVRACADKGYPDTSIVPNMTFDEGKREVALVMDVDQCKPSPKTP